MALLHRVLIIKDKMAKKKIKKKINGGRSPSKKSKISKIKKMIKLAMLRKKSKKAGKKKKR